MGHPAFRGTPTLSTVATRGAADRKGERCQASECVPPPAAVTRHSLAGCREAAGLESCRRRQPLGVGPDPFRWTPSGRRELCAETSEGRQILFSQWPSTTTRSAHRSPCPPSSAMRTIGPVRRRARLGGLLNYYALLHEGTSADRWDRTGVTRFLHPTGQFPWCRH